MYIGPLLPKVANIGPLKNNIRKKRSNEDPSSSDDE